MGRTEVPQVKKINEELAMCAQINFGNFEKANPAAAEDPMYRVAKAQLDEALGGMPVEERLALDIKRAEKRFP